ncbi:hypothetical protein DY468_21080 [Rhodopseudomonas sp. BR0M22]|nr:hypothetical protein [Rhodopseudomonas sp. BR0M22]
MDDLSPGGGASAFRRCPTLTIIARSVATKQSSPVHEASGLLRCARNDGNGAFADRRRVP